MTEATGVRISVVVPVLDELGTLEALADGVATALAGRPVAASVRRTQARSRPMPSQAPAVPANTKRATSGPTSSRIASETRRPRRTGA